METEHEKLDKKLTATVEDTSTLDEQIAREKKAQARRLKKAEGEGEKEKAVASSRVREKAKVAVADFEEPLVDVEHALSG